MTAVNTMAQLLQDYIAIRDRLPAGWFEITPEVALDPDFVALAPEILAEVEEQGVWLERKVLRCYLSLMHQCVGEVGDVANVIGINTGKIASTASADRPALLELCLSALNTYLRTAINAQDARTAYFLMNQYRILGERLMQQGNVAEVVEVAGYLKKYGRLADAAGSPFLMETAAYDVMQLVEDALEMDSPALDPLLDCFLNMGQQDSSDDAAGTQLGVRRTQIQLATLLLLRGDETRAERVIDELCKERLERVERLPQELLEEDRTQFWELMGRGVNFRYLAPERRPFLDTIVARLRAARVDVG